jgi:cell division protein FtsW
MVFSASGVGDGSGTRPARGQFLLVKQAVAAAVGLVSMWILMHIDYRHLRRREVIWTLFGGVLLLLTLALLTPMRNSTNRWIYFGGLSIQPSELAKLALVPFLSYQVVRSQESSSRRDFVLPSMLGSGLLALLVLLGRDLGSAFLLVTITGILLFLAGMPWLKLVTGLLITVPAAAAAIWLEPYRKERFLAFLTPESDPLGAGFQSLQSLIAVGSGGVFGLGLGKGLQKLHFLPYPHSDFVYSIVGEELGLIGALAVVALFAILFWRGIVAGLEAPDAFGRYLAWGLSSMLLVQALVHASVALSLMPATGVTLPFISYGGSSLVVCLLASGILLNVSQHA